jgi:hypothetical protein
MSSAQVKKAWHTEDGILVVIEIIYLSNQLAYYRITAVPGSSSDIDFCLWFNNHLDCVRSFNLGIKSFLNHVQRECVGYQRSGVYLAFFHKVNRPR